MIADKSMYLTSIWLEAIACITFLPLPSFHSREMFRLYLSKILFKVLSNTKLYVRNVFKLFIKLCCLLIICCCWFFLKLFKYTDIYAQYLINFWNKCTGLHILFSRQKTHKLLCKVYLWLRQDKFWN